MNGNAPWKDTLFRNYIPQKAASLDIGKVSEDLAEYREIDGDLIAELDALFMDFMGGDLSFPTLGRMVTAQGYETVNNMNRFIETYLDGHPQRLYVGEEGVVRPNPRSRVVSFGDWNVRHTEEADYYPLFTLGLLKAVDPFFSGHRDGQSPRAHRCDDGGQTRIAAFPGVADPQAGCPGLRRHGRRRARTRAS